MKERPILMDSASVVGILDGIKTQTRRIVKDADGYIQQHGIEGYSRIRSPYGHLVSPFGQKGDVLWVRETWAVDRGKGKVFLYKADAGHSTPFFSYDQKWKPSIFMPRQACRFRLKITDVRVERVQDIREDDAISEGYDRKQFIAWMEEAAGYGLEGYFPDRPLIWFGERWGRFHGRESWDDNPWVWAISFERIREGGAANG